MRAINLIFAVRFALNCSSKFHFRLAHEYLIDAFRNRIAILLSNNLETKITNQTRRHCSCPRKRLIIWQACQATTTTERLSFLSVSLSFSALHFRRALETTTRARCSSPIRRLTFTPRPRASTTATDSPCAATSHRLFPRKPGKLGFCAALSLSFSLPHDECLFPLQATGSSLQNGAPDHRPATRSPQSRHPGRHFESFPNWRYEAVDVRTARTAIYVRIPPDFFPLKVPGDRFLSIATRPTSQPAGRVPASTAEPWLPTTSSA